MTQVVVEISIILLLLIANGVLAMAEMSLVSARKPRLLTLAERGNRGASAALRLIENPNRLLSTVQIGITLIGILAGAFGGATLAEILAVQLVAAGMAPSAAQTTALAAVVLGITYFSLIVGELVPKRLALASPERFACVLSRPMTGLAWVARPVVKTMGWSTDLLLRLLGVKREPEQAVTDDEVRMLMKEGEMAGVFHRAEPKMVERVLNMDDALVKSIMTPRPKVVFVGQDDSHEQIWHKVVASQHSHFPVYKDNRDNVVGVVSVKAMYANMAAGAPVTIQNLMSEPLFVPATQTLVELLEAFRQSRSTSRLLRMNLEA